MPTTPRTRRTPRTPATAQPAPTAQRTPSAPVPSLDAAIVICVYTHDRWDDILAAVDSALAQRPAHGVVVVVDHDETLRVRLVDAVLGVTVVPNSGPRGLSGARNTGIAASEGAVVAFLDDDARAEPGWLAELLEPYADPAVVATGGRIDAAFDGGRPRWLPRELDWIVGCTYRGMPRERADVRNVIGAGMSFSRAALERAGGFHTGVGRERDLPVGGEETELCIRMRRVIPGARVVYTPDAVVRHRVRASRATVRYLLTRALAEGLTKARVSRLEGARSGLATETSYATRTLPRGVLRETWLAIRHRESGGLGAAAAIVATLLVTTGAFGLESVAGAIRARRADVRARHAAADGASGAAEDGRVARGKRRRPADPHRLRILQVTARYAPYVGGVETHTLEVAKRLAARGHDVTVATTDPTGDLPAHEVRDGVRIVRVPAWPGDRDWYLAPGLFRLVGARRWDVVHLQGVHTLVPPLGALAAILGGRRFVLTFHSGGHSSRVRTAARDLQWTLIAPLLRRADALIGVSRFEADRFSAALRVPRERFVVIRNGSELPGQADPHDGANGHDAMNGHDGADAHDAANGHADDGPLLLSLGRLERYKGHQRVIAAMPAVRAVRPAARLHVAGTGEYEPELRRLVDELGLEDAVTIGAVPRTELPALLARSSLVTLLSDYEAHPVAVMEALGAGRPVLVADTTGFRELAEDGLVRAIPAESAPDAAAAAILEELDRPARTEPLVLQTWDGTTDELEALYRRIVAG